jgi:hypothetical protein
VNKKIIIPSLIIVALLIVTGIATVLVQSPTQTTTRAAINRAQPVWIFETNDTQNWIGAGLKNLKVKNNTLQGTIETPRVYLYSPPRLLVGKEKSRSPKFIIRLSLQQKSASVEEINFTLSLAYLTNKNNAWENTTPLTQQVKNLFALQNYEFILPILPQDEYITAFRLGLEDLKGQTVNIESIKVE